MDELDHMFDFKVLIDATARDKSKYFFLVLTKQARRSAQVHVDLESQTKGR